MIPPLIIKLGANKKTSFMKKGNGKKGKNKKAETKNEILIAILSFFSFSRSNIVNPKLRKAGAVKIAAIQINRVKRRAFSLPAIAVTKGNKHQIPAHKIIGIIALRVFSRKPFKDTNRAKQSEAINAQTEDSV